MNWLDTPLLVYAAVADHPARSTVESMLRQGAWGSSVLVMLEVYQALTRDYAVAPESTTAEIDRLTRAPLIWRPIDANQATATFTARQQHSVDSADAHLLQLARDDRGMLITLDRRLLRAAQAEGVVTRNPITPGLAINIARWEEAHLPAKGLGRFLSGVEQWLRTEDPHVADRFVQATEQLTKLPL